MAWLFGTWMLDDSVAVRLTEWGWIAEGLRRFAVVLVVAVAFGAAVLAINRRFVRPVFRDQSRSLRYLPVALASVMALAGVAGVVRFVIRKPFM